MQPASVLLWRLFCSFVPLFSGCYLALFSQFQYTPRYAALQSRSSIGCENIPCFVLPYSGRMEDFMDTVQKPKFGLTNNQLKIIAMVSMLCDHVGLLFFPDVVIFRAIGRIAFPIFAYMIAEGCRYTKNRAKYLGMIAAMAVAFQVVYFVAMQSLYQGILVTFSLAIITIYSIDGLFGAKKLWGRLLSVLGLAFMLVFVCVLPLLLTKTDFDIDYGVWGILLPLVVYFMPSHKWRIGGASALLLVRAIYYGVLATPITPVQWWSLLTLPLLFLYNGERGRAKMKYVFYIFYPAHLVILYGIAMVVMMLQ